MLLDLGQFARFSCVDEVQCSQLIGCTATYIIGFCISPFENSTLISLSRIMTKFVAFDTWK